MKFFSVDDEQLSKVSSIFAYDGQRITSESTCMCFSRRKGNWLILFYRFQLIRRQKHVARSFHNHIMNENCHNQQFSYFCNEETFSIFSIHPPTPNNHIIGSDCIQFPKTILMSFIWAASAGYCFLFHPVSSSHLNSL